jgi:hypothetical protein
MFSPAGTDNQNFHIMHSKKMSKAKLDTHSR